MRTWYTCRMCGKTICLDTERNNEDEVLAKAGGWTYQRGEGYRCGRCGEAR